MPSGSIVCQFCGTALANNLSAQQEIVIKEGLCNRIKNTFNVQNGHGLLTNKRFIYNKHSFAKVAALGILVNLTSGDFDFDIPLSDIIEIKNGRQGVSKTLVIVTTSGENYNFYFTNRQQWIVEFEKLLRQNYHTKFSL